ncbi:MAG TPA: hypothetical protein VIA62_09565 [Thermoanaerobaculia bacterium]|jgi:hypothetical protein|nr:hypothetical protein [Thermoanaerobaculia bacterium]
MKKTLPRRLNLNRETLRQLTEPDLRVPAGAAATNPCPYTLQLACHSAQIPSCRCTVAV